jgi:hypothetical protein
MRDDEAAWLALKSDWQANVPLESVLSNRVRASLLRRIWFSRLWLAIEVVSFLFLGLVIAQHFALRQFGAGTTLALITGFCVVASLWVRRARLVGNMESLKGMVDFTLSRAKRLLRIVYGSYAVMAMLLAMVFAGGVSTQDDRFLARVIWLGISLAVCVAIHIRTHVRIRRFESIRGTYDEGRDT